VGRYLWPILIVAAITIGLVVSAAGTETRSQIEYLTRMGDEATELSKSADALRQIISRLHVTSRTDFTTVIASIEEDLAASKALADEEPPTPTVQPLRSLFRQVVQAWGDGIALFSTAVLGAADHPDDPNPIDQMASALAELRAGDGLYADLLVELERDDVPAALTPFPGVAMLPEPAGLVTLALGYVDAARSELNTLGLRPGLAVAQIVSDPEWQVDANQQVALPATDTVAFSVVISNVGNVVSEGQQLLVTLIGGPEEVELEETVGPLQPGRQVTVVFDPIGVDPDGLYEVVATILTTTEDTNLDDNQIRVQFNVNEG
jgi:hypothetical protein